jgi:hypothetical protein
LHFHGIFSSLEVLILCPRCVERIDSGCGGAYAFRQLQKEPKGFLWSRRRLKSVRIRVVIVRRQRAASIARFPRIVRLSRATAGMRNVVRAKRVRRDKRSSFPDLPDGGGPGLGGGHHSAWRGVSSA